MAAQTSAKPSTYESLLGGYRRREQADTGEPGRRILNLDLDKLAPNPSQPRKYFGEEDLQSLADSIAQRGLIQPIIVTPNTESPDSYWIVAGERRWRAFQLLRAAATDDKAREQWSRIPSIERIGISDTERALDALAENVLRENLSAIEEAEAVKALAETQGLSTDDIAAKMGLSLRRVQLLMRLAGAPQILKDALTSTGAFIQTLDESGQPVTRLNRKGEAVPRREHMSIANSLTGHGLPALDLTVAVEFVRIYDWLKQNKPKRADAELEKALAQALSEGWSRRRIEEFRAGLEGRPKAPGKQTDTPTGEGRATKAGFANSDLRLVVDYGRVDQLSDTQRSELCGILEGLLGRLRTARDTGAT